MSKIDHTPITEKGHARTMDSEFQTLTREEFASLLSVGLTSAASIPFEHELRLTMLGYIADLDGRLRVTTSGNARIAAAGFENRPLLDSN
jgi:hypothetical protein